MARIIGGITTSHVPAIGGAIAKSLQQDPYWKPFFDGFVPVRQWIAETRPDTVVVVYNDHGLNEQQAAAIRAKNVLQLLEAGGNAYYLAKFAGIFGLDMQDIGAQQTGVTKAEFQAKLNAYAAQ